MTEAQLNYRLAREHDLCGRCRQRDAVAGETRCQRCIDYHRTYDGVRRPPIGHRLKRCSVCNERGHNKRRHRGETQP